MYQLRAVGGALCCLLTGSIAWGANPSPQPSKLLLEELTSKKFSFKDLEFQNATPLEGPKYWFLGSPTKDGVEGIRATQAAEEGYFKDKKATPIIVAVLDSGIDINQPELKDHIWKNEGENCELDGTGMDGIDNDGNGYVDDCRGWNFLGTVLEPGDQLDMEKIEAPNSSLVQNKVTVSDGKTKKEVNFVSIEQAPLTVSAELGRLERKEEALTAEEEAYKKKLQEIFDEQYIPLSRAGFQSEGAREVFGEFDKLYPKFFELIDQYMAFYDEKAKEGEGKVVAKEFLTAAIGKFGPEQGEPRLASMFKVRVIPGRIRAVEGDLARDVLYSELRLAVGDLHDQWVRVGDFLWFNKDHKLRSVVMTKDRPHGNPDVIAREPNHGTWVAHIIVKILTEAGVPFKIMPVRTLAQGDEHDDDVIAAIKYAAANGAVVANGSWGKAVSPKWKEVIQAYRDSVKVAQARKSGGKTFVMCHAAGNDGKSNDLAVHYPSRYIPKLDGEGKFVEWEFDPESLAGWLETGASTSQRGAELLAPFTNYGVQSVHLFAPGVNIVSANPFGGEVSWPGTSAASPMTAGVAGVITSYYPNLSQQQVEEAVLSVRTTGLKDLEVNLPAKGGPEGTATLDKLSIKGGLLDVINAVAAAEEITGGKK